MDNYQSLIGNVPSIQDVLNAPPPPAPTAPAQQGTGLFASSLESGGRGLLSSSARGLGAAANFIGATSVGKSLNSYADQQRALQVQDQNPEYANAGFFSSPGAALYQTLQGLPTMAGAVAGGALAGLAVPEEAALAGVAGLGGLAARVGGAAAGLYPSAVGDAAQRAIDEHQPENDGKALAYGIPAALVQGALPGLGEGLLAGGARSEDRKSVV